MSNRHGQLHRIIYRVAVAFFISPFYAHAALADCRLEAVDMVTATAVARCGGDPVLLERGKKFRDLSIADVSPDRVVLTDSEGGTILWYIAEGAKPSRVEHIRVVPPPGGDGEPLLAPAAGRPGASVPVSN